MEKIQAGNAKCEVVEEERSSIAQMRMDSRKQTEVNKRMLHREIQEVKRKGNFS